MYRRVLPYFWHVLCRPPPPSFWPLYRACISCISANSKNVYRPRATIRVFDTRTKSSFSIHHDTCMQIYARQIGPFRYMHDTCQYMIVPGAHSIHDDKVHVNTCGVSRCGFSRDGSCLRLLTGGQGRYYKIHIDTRRYTTIRGDTYLIARQIHHT